MTDEHAHVLNNSVDDDSYWSVMSIPERIKSVMAFCKKHGLAPALAPISKEVST